MFEIPDGLKEAMQRVLGQKKPRISKKPLVEITAEEVARFQELESRVSAFSKEANVTMAKLKDARNRLWADLNEKYGLYDKNLHYDAETSALYEVLGDIEGHETDD